MAQNQVTVKGIVDPQGICDRLRRRTMRNATVISSPHPPPQAKGDAAGKEDPPPTPPVVHSQVSEVKTVGPPSQHALRGMCAATEEKDTQDERYVSHCCSCHSLYDKSSHPCLIKFT